MTNPAQTIAVASVPSAPASGSLDAASAARLTPLSQGLGLTEQEVLSLGLDLIEDLLDEDPEILRARVAEVIAARSVGR